jgi:hypothetical protein
VELTTCIVMATFNGAALVEQQFASIFAQTTLPDFIVVRDDDSTDNTVEIVQGIRDQAPVPISIICGHPNLGYRNNFAAALRQAKADIYFFSDQDDVWYADKVQKHLDVYRADRDALLVISNQDIVGPNLEPSGRTTLEQIRKRRGNSTEFVHGCCTSFRNALYGLACHPAEGFAHDDWVHAIADACGGRRVIERPLQGFRRHDNTTTSSKLNSFDAPSTMLRGALNACEVAANLRRRERGARAVAEALREDEAMFPQTRRRGIGICDENARRYASRAVRLEQSNVSGLLGTVAAAVSGEQSVRQGLADIARIAAGFQRRIFRGGG